MHSHTTPMRHVPARQRECSNCGIAHESQDSDRPSGFFRIRWHLVIAVVLFALPFSNGSEPVSNESSRKTTVADRLWSRAIVAPLDDEAQRLRWSLEAAISSDRDSSTYYEIIAYIGYSHLLSDCDDATADSFRPLKEYLQHPEQRDNILSSRDSNDISDLSIRAFDIMLGNATPEERGLVVSVYEKGGMDAACLAVASLHPSLREIALQQCFMQSNTACREVLSKHLDNIGSDNGFSAFLSSSYYAERGDAEECMTRLRTAVSKTRMRWGRMPVPLQSAVAIPMTRFSEKHGLSGMATSRELLEAFMIREESIRSSRDFLTVAFHELLTSVQTVDSRRIKSLLHVAGLRMLLDENAWEHQVVLGITLCDDRENGLGMTPAAKQVGEAEVEYCESIRKNRDLSEFVITSGTRIASSGRSPREAESRMYHDIGAPLRKVVTKEVLEQLRRAGVTSTDTTPSDMK